MAATGSGWGLSGSNGRAFTAATRTSSRRKASDTVSPIFFSATAASLSVRSSIWCVRRCGREQRNQPWATLPRFRLDRVISLACRRLQILIPQLDLQLAIAAVLVIVQRSVTDGIL